MSIYRSTNPLDFNAVDGIVIDEVAPAPNIQGVGTGTVILCGQFERGPTALTSVPSTASLMALFGVTDKGGLLALKNKKFSNLKLVRVTDGSGAVAATKVFKHSTTDTIAMTALSTGAYGNSITVKIEAGSNQGSKYTITDTTAGAVLPQEIYDDVLITAAAVALAASQLVSVSVLSTANEPDTAAATALATGADGTPVDADYAAAIAKCAVEGAGNVLFLDSYNTVRNAALKAHADAVQDKIVILAGPQSQTVAAAVTDAALSRQTDGRCIYAYPWVQTLVNGVNVMTSPASWLASILSQTAPSVDPASADNIQFTGGINALAIGLARADYITLMNGGVAAFEQDNDLGGIKIKSGVTTQIANSSKKTVARRRMADYLSNSVGLFLKLYQNGQNSRGKRDAVKAAMLAFIKQNEDAGILPKDSEVKGGKAKLVDTESLNTDADIASGYFKILYRQRIYSSMRFIVLQAEIGESVVVTDNG